jgi:hypothetical protein
VGARDTLFSGRSEAHVASAHESVLPRVVPPVTTGPVLAAGRSTTHIALIPGVRGVRVMISGA